MVLKKSEIGIWEIWLYYYRARYYLAELGRFISRDPIGVRDNVNLYGYVVWMTRATHLLVIWLNKSLGKVTNLTPISNNISIQVLP